MVLALSRTEDGRSLGDCPPGPRPCPTVSSSSEDSSLLRIFGGDSAAVDAFFLDSGATSHAWSSSGDSETLG